MSYVWQPFPSDPRRFPAVVGPFETVKEVMDWGDAQYGPGWRARGVVTEIIAHPRAQSDLRPAPRDAKTDG